MSAESEAPGATLGTSTVRFEQPDLFFVSFIGEVTAEDMTSLGDFFRKYASGRFYTILNVEQFKTLSGKKEVKSLPMASGTAIVGATQKMQLVLSLVNKAYSLFNMGKNNPLAFVGTTEEASRWIEHLRSNTPAS